jgi:hypothetical protein
MSPNKDLQRFGRRCWHAAELLTWGGGMSIRRGIEKAEPLDLDGQRHRVFIPSTQ